MGGRGATLSLYLTTEDLGDLHAMIPGFTDLIGVFAIKVDSNVDDDDGFITITRFFSPIPIKAAAYELMQQNSLRAPSFW